ncbi:tyrosine-type recombinase/integrase [Rossellomorea vietnamensis]|uniref:tyrosine-type recombinase/integrase n=1 Tax=Rossellomorea vietnamensis TaxID=218284 RepID=UPI001653535A|nr:tyrosine-type recombinase/integrase [Rossellomorea vietnamensis]
MEHSHDIIDRFSVWLRKEGKSANTVTTYQRELKKYQDWLQTKGLTLNELSRNEVQSYINFLENQGRSPITNDKIFGAIRTFSKFLKRPDLTAEIEIKTAEKKNEIETLNNEQCESILKKVRDESNCRNTAIVYTLLHTGIRVSELCALDRSDVDLEAKTLEVNTPAGAHRIIPLSEEANDYLKTYIQISQVKTALFVSRTNERLTERSIQYILKKFDVNPHKLRHTFCQRLVDKGVSIEIVSRLAGHKDINVTKRYIKPKVEQLALEEAIQKTFSKDR